MTYVSRRTRIIVSRWLDECDVEYRLKACRKRSDGRLKRYSSCDDIRAWINDGCVRHEYLADQMSNGGFSGRPPFRLFGRFIPVPILFEIAQNSKTEGKGKEKTKSRDVKGVDGNAESASILSSALNERSADKDLNGETDSSEEDSKGSNSDLVRMQWEKNQLEKRLLQCTCLLNKAIEKLECVDDIIGPVEKRRESKKEEESAFNKYKMSCSCMAISNPNNGSSWSKCHMKRSKDHIRCNELMRKISGLREKLRRIQECRHEVNCQIRSTKKRSNCHSSLQVTELYSRREDTHLKKLQKKLEKLIAERGRLLSEMCHALTSLNNIKKSSMNFRFRDIKTSGNGTDFNSEKLGEPPTCNCGCKCSDNDRRSLDSTKHSCSDTSSECSDNECCNKRKNIDQNLSSDCRTTSHDSDNFKNQNTEQFICDVTGKNDEHGKSNKRSSTASQDDNASTPTHDKEDPQTQDQGKPEGGTEKADEKKTKKSKVKFVCPQRGCQEKLEAYSVSAFEGSLSAEQQAVISCVLKDIERSRPATSPTTKKERWAASRERNSVRQYPGGHILDRRVKSETTMKEIEKTLRNYQGRLCNLDSLESKVEKMKRKLSETERLKKCLAKAMAEAKMQRCADKEKSEREITRLCSENWELKKQVQQLAVKYSQQAKKMVNLKCDAMRARELECQAEELKKELSEYRDGFEHQRKCISKWESVVAVQRTEIENLMNHIRKLTTIPPEEDDECDDVYQDRRSVQRSRSYSPEMAKKRGGTNKSHGHARTLKSAASDDEENFCCCNNHSRQESRRTSHMGGADYCSMNSGRREWCN